jgi:hypothetical protein
LNLSSLSLCLDLLLHSLRLNLSLGLQELGLSVTQRRSSGRSRNTVELVPGQHTRREQSLWSGRSRRQGQAAGQYDVHVLARALEHLDVALLLAEHHVAVMALLGRLE